MSATVFEKNRFPASGGHQMRGWLSRPEGKTGKLPGVLVIHEMTGLVSNVRPVVERFAENGYVAFAPDIYDRPGVKALCIAKTMLSMSTGRGDAVQDLHAAVSFLKNHEAVDGDRLAVAGFCMGGGFALLMALHPDIKASAPYYGTSNPYFDQIADSCPVIGSYGGRDAMFAPQADRLKRALEKAGVPHDVKVYPDAGHSYMMKELTGPIMGLGYKLYGIGPLKVAYNPEAAEDSWKRMLGFFSEHV